jgi:predicted RNA-binding protein with PIN domain
MPYWFDGNNLIGRSAAILRTDPTTRRSFLALLSGYATGRGGRFTVFFDGDDPDRSMPPRGVRVRYSAPLSTDDAILRQAEGAQAPSEIIVVTNDHGLAARCRTSGLKTMDWRQFTDKMSARTHAPSKTAPKDPNVNLEEWSRYFGFDPDTLE